MKSLFPPLTDELRRHVDAIPALVDRVFPLPKRFRSGLPHDVAELSRLLTSGRGERNESYLGEVRFLSAYLRYFLPWNIYRLARLLPALDLPLHAAASGSRAAPGSCAATVTDLGSGPLTLPMALWISRPDLRSVPLEFRCLDRTGAVLDAGKKLFAALVNSDTVDAACPWTIKTIKAFLGEPVRFPKADLVTAVNLFNELFWKLPRSDHHSLGAFAEKQARLLSALSLDSGSVLVIEPGVPRCGEFISLIREAFADKGRVPLAPCPHVGPCPLPGIVGAGTRWSAHPRWCHFAFDTADAPAGLHRLSEAAGLPKERAVLSFLQAGPAISPGVDTPPAAGPDAALPVRVVSDAFPLTGAGPGNRSDGKRPGPAALYGRYGCSVRGLVLVTGKKAAVEGLESGALVLFAEKAPVLRDGKSGAMVLELR